MVPLVGRALTPLVQQLGTLFEKKLLRLAGQHGQHRRQVQHRPHPIVKDIELRCDLLSHGLHGERQCVAERLICNPRGRGFLYQANLGRERAAQRVSSIDAAGWGHPNE